jgi:hypothetical protein
MVLETIAGGLFGGLLRLAPEAFKLFDRANERKHELAMLSAEMEFARVRGEIAMRQTEAVMTVAEMDAIGEAFKEQSETAKNGGWLISAISALVRPMITYAFAGTYFAVKLAGYLIALEQGGNWRDVLIAMWTPDDMAMMNLILTFWFVGRVWQSRRD